MNRYYIIIYWALFFNMLIFSSCGHKIQEAGLSNIFIPLAEKQVLPANELFDSIRFVRLETTDSCLIPEFSATSTCILWKNEYFYLASSFDISIFDSNGKWVRTISHRGNGPGEYQYVSAFMVNDNDEIFIMDRVKKSVLLYSSNDIFLKSYHYGDSLSIQNIGNLNDSLFVLTSSSFGDGCKFHIVHKKTQEITNSYWPTKSHIFSYAYKYNFPYYQGKLLFHEYQNNSVFEITPDRAILRYMIDIDGRIPPDGYWAQDIPWDQLLREHTARGYIDNIEFFAESDKHILLRYSGSPESSLRGNVWIDKMNGESILFDKIAFDNALTWEPGRIIYSLADGWLVFPIPVDQLFTVENSEFRNQFPNLLEDDNPILCIAKIR
ncbi:MAG: 6-bladed beta-propeller [Prevotella sp.]|jgi:hypothetical protein|nr:6-bladed beta-propeller [Prevotella sp.]